MAKEEDDLKAPTQGAVIDPVHRRDATDSPSKKQLRRLAREQLETDWKNFPDLPGTHLSRKKTWQSTEPLLGPDGDVRVSLSGGMWRKPSYHADGRTYQWRQVRNAKSEGKLVKDLLDVTTDVPILRMSGRHFAGKATTRVVLADQTILWFPVRLRHRHSLMSAVDEAGNHLIEYRWGQFKPTVTEVVIHPSAIAIPHIEVVAAISLSLLERILEHPSGA
jgi:hypothetical protein